MATGLELARRGRLRHWLHSDAPASRGAQVFMFVAALLCGAALSGLLFVGVWRHTAGEAAQSQAARADDQRALQASRRENASLNESLANEQALLASANRAHKSALVALALARSALARAQSALAQSRSELLRTKAADAAALRAATARASALSTDANALARASATLDSELTALETYAQNPGPTGIDPGYLANQVRYLEASAAAASSAANDLASRASG